MGAHRKFCPICGNHTYTIFESEPIAKAFYGLIIGDALGFPHEFSWREDLMYNPIEDMDSYGTFNLPKGSWSDDTSMTLATMDFLLTNDELDYEKLMEEFSAWVTLGKNTPFDYSFDKGHTCSSAIRRFDSGIPALKCGLKTVNDNGNGSLMRMLPVAFYLMSRGFTKIDKESYKIIKDFSRVTHAHPISIIACTIFCSMMFKIEPSSNKDLHTKKLIEYLQLGINEALTFFEETSYVKWLTRFDRLKDLEKFRDIYADTIESSGYVVNTLEVSIYCLINTYSYEDAILMTVNFGRDTDTNCAVCGAIAGYFYTDSSSKFWEWRKALQRLEFLSDKIYMFAEKYGTEV